MELLGDRVRGRLTRSSQKLALANLKTEWPEVSLTKTEAEDIKSCDDEHEVDDENKTCGEEDMDDNEPNLTGMFVNVDVEVDANADLLYANENSSSEELEYSLDDNQDTSCNTSTPETLSLEGGFKAKGIIAKLAQKLNSKLNAVMVPRPTESLLACLEPEVSVATEGGVSLCPWCPFTSSTAESLEEHKMLCHNGTSGNSKEEGDSSSHQHSCEKCGATFAKSWNLKRHYYMHSGERPFLCVDCGERFGSGGDLSVHRRSRHSVQPQRRKRLNITQQRWMCYICRVAFFSKDSFLAHQRTTHASGNPSQKKLMCQHCAQLFDAKEKLEEHLRIAHTVCQFCNKSFSNLDYLMRGHMLTQHKLQFHEDSGITVCLQCKEELNDDAPLKEHSCLLSSLRPFRCKDCGDSFRGANDLKVHMRIHTGERPYRCHECGESFTQRGNLTVHIRTHTGERPFECHICGRCFMKSSNLKEHMKVHKESRGQNVEEVSVVSCIPVQNPVDVWADKDPSILKKVSEMAKESNAFRAAIAGKLRETGFVSQEKEKSVNFRDTIVERVKQTGVLSFGNGNVSLRLL